MAKYWKLLFPSGHTASKLFSRRATTPQPLPPPPPSRPDRSESFWRTLAMIDSRNEKHSCQKCILVLVFHRAILSGLFCIYFSCFNFRSFKKMIFTWLANGKWMDLNCGPRQLMSFTQISKVEPSGQIGVMESVVALVLVLPLSLPLMLPILFVVVGAVVGVTVGLVGAVVDVRIRIVVVFSMTRKISLCL